MVRKMKKIVFLGSASVGKTSLILSYKKGILPNSPTIGVEIHNMKIHDLDLVVWDLSGQEKFRNMINNYLIGASIYVLVFDLAREDTFEDIKSWINFIKNTAGEKSKIILVGNKKDLGKKIPDDVIKNYLRENNSIVDYLETSAKTGENVQKLFEKLTQLAKSL